MNKYDVMEIFDSIQGEGTLMGVPVTFIRLAGCNLKCPWCDTKESWAAADGKEMSLDEIVELCTQQVVVITGGEPTIQDIGALADRLAVEGKYVTLETNGTRAVPRGKFHQVVCSPKPPHYNISSECLFNEAKIVVDEDMTEDKLNGIVDKILSKSATPEMVNIWLQPEGNNMKESATKAYKMVMGNPRLRLGIQMHKIFDLR